MCIKLFKPMYETSFYEDPGGDWCDSLEVQCELAARDKRIAELEAELKSLTWGVVANAGHLSKERRQRWAHVMDATGIGSASSIMLCKSAGFDPNELKGGAE